MGALKAMAGGEEDRWKLVEEDDFHNLFACTAAAKYFSPLDPSRMRCFFQIRPLEYEQLELFSKE